MSRIIEYLVVGISAFMWAIEGYHVGTWQCWLNIFCMAAIYTCGWYKGKGEQI